MFDYSNITPRDFEYIAQEYLKATYPGFSWSLTKATGDGNRDVELSYQFLDQDLEYWAEAKFTRATKIHKLQKGQLDPTLLSAMLYSKPVFIKFISNSLAPENYYYRLTDFQFKTNIGVTMVLKDEFEQWLIQNPDVCQRYGVIWREEQKAAHVSDSSKITIAGTLITDEINMNGYALEHKLIQGKTYFLYFLISTDKPFDKVSLKFQTPGFCFLPDSSFLSNPEGFSLHQGTYGYKFRFLAEKQFSGEVFLSLWKDDKCICKTSTAKIAVLPSSSYAIAYAKQSKIEAEIIEFAKNTGRKNSVAVITGNGASGKTYLIENLYREFSRRYETFYLCFSGNELYNCSQFCSLLLYLNIGDIRDYSMSAIKDAAVQYASPEKKRFLIELLERADDAPEKCIHFLQLKQRQEILQMIFPQHNTTKKIIILEDIHKLKASAPVAELFHGLITEFAELENNQLIIATTRENVSEFANYRAVLPGLDREDKTTTLKHYFPNIPEPIQFHRSTNSVLTFSNILRELIERGADNEHDPLRSMAQIKQRFERNTNRSSQEYQTYLNGYSKYGNLMELVFSIGSGIPYDSLSKLYDAADIDYLIAQKIFKLAGSRVYPFHDDYTASYLNGKSMSSHTEKLLEKLVEMNEADSYIYLALLLKQGNAQFFSKISAARELRDRYFRLSRVYESYLLAQAIVAHIDFDERLSMEEVYDVYVLATSSFYEKDCDEIITLYNIVITQGNQYEWDTIMWGVLLRTKTELMNQYYWDLRLDKLKTALESAENAFPKGAPEDPEILRFACIHRFNRRMIFELLMGRYETAKTEYEHCVCESMRLNHRACRGFAEMDYGKGLYLSNPKEAYEHINEALEIFEEIGTEHRRQLDCACEAAFLSCLINGADAEKIHALRGAALTLQQAHYDEIYAKAKLKLAALYMCGSTPDLASAKTEIIEAEYALSYRPCKRLKMLFANIKYVHYTLTNQKTAALNELEIHKRITASLGDDYSAVPRENMLQRFPQRAAFYSGGSQISPDTVWIDPRIW